MYYDMTSFARWGYTPEGPSPFCCLKKMGFKMDFILQIAKN